MLRREGTSGRNCAYETTDAGGVPFLRKRTMLSDVGPPGALHVSMKRGDHRRRLLLSRLFDDAMDGLEITYDVYYRIDLDRPRCIHVADWFLRKGIEKGEVLILGLYPRPLTMLFGQLGFSVTELAVRLQRNFGIETEEGVAMIELPKALTELPRDVDVIVCDDLLQQFPSPRATLVMLTRRLRTNGVLVLITANVARGASRAQLLRGGNVYPWMADEGRWDERTEGDHTQEIVPYREYTLREVESILSDAGLHVTDSGYVIGKKPIDNVASAMSLGEYFARRLYHIIQVVVPPLRSHLFVAATKGSGGAGGGRRAG